MAGDIAPLECGAAVRVRIDDEWHDGIMLDRPRKMWVKVDALNIIADENNIQELELIGEAKTKVDEPWA